MWIDRQRLWTPVIAVVSALISVAAFAQQQERFEPGAVVLIPTKAVEVGPFTLTNGEPATVKTTARLEWTPEALVLRFTCEDKQIVTEVEGRDNPDLWKNDSVEVFFDVKHGHNLDGDWIHLLVTADGQVMDQRGPVSGYFTSGDPENGDVSFNLEGLTVKTDRTATGWAAEVTIPWASLGGVPKAGDLWGFNLARGNQPEGEYQALFPTHGPYFRIDHWGHLLFAADALSPQAMKAKVDEGHEAVVKHERELKSQRDRFEAHRYCPEQSWVELDGVIYGAKPDERGPIGGGNGYVDVVTKGDYTARTPEELIEVLGKAKAGEVVFIPGNVEIDVTTMVYTDKLVLKVPAGVTLASDRGVNGSPGAMLMSDAFQTSPMIRAEGDDVTIKGLRLRGPDTKIRNDHHDRAYTPGDAQRSQKYYYAFPTSNGVQTDHNRLTVANCEVTGWSHGGVYLRRGKGHLVTHSHLHHNRRQGLGYGVAMDVAEVVIEYCRFSHNRHDIAATGRPGSGYIARHNIVEAHDAISHHFDMHGGGDRQDGTNIAGDYIHIHNNSVFANGQPVAIRGAATQYERIHHNWFPRSRPSNQPGDLRSYRPTNAVRTRGNAEIHDNAYLMIYVE